MGKEFAHIAFTPAVKATQQAHGSRRLYQRLDDAPAEFAGFTRAEQAFISGRDGFYQASVSETGWPYMQYRGGPAGFLRIVDERTLRYNDLEGNQQYLSLTNLQGNDRMMLFLMDYANQRRMKIWGRASFLESEHERVVVIRVEATDWNCPQHITPRYTLEEFPAGAGG